MVLSASTCERTDIGHPHAVDASVKALFTPLRIKQLTVPNRVVMAPMTRKQSPGGVPGPEVASYYAKRARHQVGLIISEGTVIAHPASADHPDVPRFYGEDALSGWGAVLAAVHAEGGRIIPQLWHVGAMRPADAAGAEPIGPSGLQRRNRRVGHAMSDTEIASVIDAFADAAATACCMGFDGVELHGAHGYLIDQFLWEDTNARQDVYGGDPVARTRFAAEVIAACRHRVDTDFPIAFRCSQWKLQNYRARLATTPRELAALLEPLVDAGTDMFDCSTRYFWQPEFEGSNLNLAGWTKKLTGRPVITVGAIGQDADFLSGRPSVASPGLERLARMVEDGEVDLVAVGRALLADPEWVLKIRDNRRDALLPFTTEALGTLT
jgi:2,4-dienoyl-CoA reductase-like NADH-dependent reductase (Old Yellow Enzyme family)